MSTNRQSLHLPEELHQELNAADCLPASAYRRNSGEYELICYVNNMVGCYLSKNYSALALFRNRAEAFMRAKPVRPETHEYYRLVSNYLAATEQFVPSEPQL